MKWPSHFHDILGNLEIRRISLKNSANGFVVSLYNAQNNFKALFNSLKFRSQVCNVGKNLRTSLNGALFLQIYVIFVRYDAHNRYRKPVNVKELKRYYKAT